MSDESLSPQAFAEQLQQTIEQLQQLVVKLNREPIETLPSVTYLQRLQETVTHLNLSLNPSLSGLKTDKETELRENLDKAYAEFDEFIEDAAEIPTEPSRASSPPVLEDTEIPITQPIGKRKDKEKSLFQKILTPIRGILPTGINQKLSDGVLTTIVGGIIAGVIIWAVLLIAPNRQEMAEVLPIPSPEGETQTEIETPAELESPEPPQAILLEPPPEPQVSPEQRLIQAVQADIADITSRYPEGLIDSIEANFAENYLIVVLGDDWYQLRVARQNDVAKGIWQKAQNLDFQKLDLRDKDGQLVARSPVVGQQMIILLRTPVNS